MIHRLDEKLAQDLCAQQVITSITDCVKQLVDNAIDAESTRVQIILEDYGKKSIQIHDDGHGIDSFEFLGQKGTTSKNQESKKQIKTLGFRGEALHSLAKVSSKMQVETQTKSSPNTTKIFDVKKMQEKIRDSRRGFGTTVRIQSLFQYLPVRRYELLERFKQFLKKTDNLIRQYTLIFPKISFIFKNIRSQKSQILIQTAAYNEGNYVKGWKNRLQQVLGQKLGNKMIYINTQNIEGWILGKIQSGSSNQNNFIHKNIHYTYLNCRPIDPLPKIIETLNYFYKKYKKNTKYAFILNLKINWKKYDVNLAPNKRQIVIDGKIVDDICEDLRKFINENIVEEIVSLNKNQQMKINQIFVNKQEPQIQNKANMTIKSQKQPKQQKIQAQQIPKNKQIINNQKQQIPFNNTQNRKKKEQQTIPMMKAQQNTLHPQQITNKHKINQPFKKIQHNQFRNDFKNAIKQRINQRKSQVYRKQVKIQEIYDNKQIINRQKDIIQGKQISQQKFNGKNQQRIESSRMNNNIGQKIGEGLGQWLQSRKKCSLKKQQFNYFKILGQFNLGFIVCLLNDDYYLIDQHAASQKYHFEKLMNSSLQSIQTAQQINLAALQRENLDQHEDILRKQGYHFTKLEENKILLTRVPSFLGKIYGKQYFMQLLEERKKLKDHQTFYMAAASKACRTAVMVGQTLKKQQMAKIIRSLALLQSPWNCPHGRPTLIYLGKVFQFNYYCNLKDQKKQDYKLI